MASKLTGLFDKLMDLLCPGNVQCALCGREIKEGRLCTKCEMGLKLNSSSRCIRCSRPTVSVEDKLCEQCKMTPDMHYDRAFAPLVYKGSAVSLMRAFKYHDRRDLAGFFGDFLEAEYKTVPETDIIVPVPMQSKKLVDRMYAQADELALELSRRVGKKCTLSVCRKVKDTGTQTVLNPKERMANVKGAFKVVDKSEIKGKKVLVVDDVFTTGATVSELARVLKRAGASVVYVLCACIAVYKI